jgi:hypothetical protein
MLGNSCVAPELAASQELSHIELINRTCAEQSVPAVLLGHTSAGCPELSRQPSSVP